MLKVGLTGGIGCGKSSAVACFRRLGVPIVDADRIARDVVLPGEPVLLEIVRVFGAAALTADGALDRAWMRNKIFAEPSARLVLEALLHPVIRQRIQQGMSEAHDAGFAYVVVDIPLLVEQGYPSMFDHVVVVDCLPEQQIQRVRERDGSSDGQIASIMSAQASRMERLQHATDVLDNTSSKEWLEFQVNRLHDKLLGISNS